MLSKVIKKYIKIIEYQVKWSTSKKTINVININSSKKKENL
jgi:hypothetical protein